MLFPLATKGHAPAMTEHDPFEEDFPEEEFFEFFEELADLLGSVPLWLWLLIALVVASILKDLFSPSRDDSSSAPQREPRQQEGPPRDRYTIHDDIEEDRTYETPSESDPIESPNKVDRSLLGKIKRLARLGRTRGDD